MALAACSRFIRMCPNCFSILNKPTSCVAVAACHNHNSQPQRQKTCYTGTSSHARSTVQGHSTNQPLYFTLGGKLKNFHAQHASSLFSFSKSSSKDLQLQIGNLVSSYGSRTPSRFFSTDESQSHIPPKSSSSKDRDAKKSPISWKTLSIVAVISGAIIWTLNSIKKEKEQMRKQQKQVGKPLLGGPWQLTDHHGNVRSSKDFHGQWILIYFGFTNCPDICPEYVEKIVDFISKVDTDKSMPEIQPLVITVDPERDTPAILKEYLAEFSPKLLGMTGSIDDINKATRAYRVYYSMGPKDEDNDYIVDHSIISYLVNPQGDFVDYFGQNKTSEEMFKTSKAHVLKYYKNNS